MGKHDKTLAKHLSGTADSNIAFADLVNLLVAKGFLIRQGGGSHIIATRDGVRDRITLQPDGSKAKGYQVRQIRNVFLNHPELLR